MKTPPRVQLHWRDISPHEETWIEATKLKPDTRPIKSVGWLVYEDEGSVILAQDFDPWTKRYSGVVTYPRGCVTQIRPLEPPRRA